MGSFSHPSILGLEFSDASDLDKIKSVGSSHEWMQKQVDFVGELTEFYNGEVMSFYNIFSPIQQIRIYRIFQEGCSYFQSLASGG